MSRLPRLHRDDARPAGPPSSGHHYRRGPVAESLPDTPLDGVPGAAPSGSLVARALSWMAGGQLVSQILWFGSLIVLGALLPPSAFGVVAVGLVVLWAGNVLVGTGTRAAIIATPDLSAADVRSATALTAGTGLVIALGVIVLAGPIATTFASGGDAAALRGLAPAIAFMGLAIVPMALLDKRLAFKRTAGAKVVATLAASLGAIGAGLAGAGVGALVARQVLFQGILAILAWTLVRGVLPRGGPRRGRLALRRAGSRAFFALAVADFTALTVDTLVVGRLTDATQLGLYTLAFTLAFSPLTQFSWQIGQVLFPVAAATEDVARVAARTLIAVRMTALVLLPLAPPAIILAPVLVPAVLGERWSGLVAPFQVLVVAGVAHAVLNCLGESLSAKGGIWFRARAHAVWACATIAAVFALVSVAGIRGAAIAHLAVLVPLWGSYAVRGAPLIGLQALDLWRAVRVVAAAAAAQLVATAAVLHCLVVGGAPRAVSSWIAAAAGFALAGALLARGPSSPLRQSRALITSVRGGPHTAS
jgi:O-antigen/teichoic acid export membrane protein